VAGRAAAACSGEAQLGGIAAPSTGARRLRPRHAYALGLVYWEARLGARLPRIANFLSQTAPFASLAKRAAGITPERQAPPFAEKTFAEWFATQDPRPAAKRVLLWPDTFTNHFEPGIAIAAVEVLQAAGFEVAIPNRPLCCGRPLYDYGMLSLAKRQLRQILDSLREDIRLGTPVVVLEPSCGAVFRDELANMLPEQGPPEEAYAPAPTDLSSARGLAGVLIGAGLVAAGGLASRRARRGAS